MKEIIIATNNKDKFQEIRKLMEPLGFHCLSLSDIGFNDEIVEDGETFFDNAYKKARTIAQMYHMPTIGDDSGLIVNALPDLLGVKSKRFSEQATYAANNELLLEMLQNTQDRGAHFVSMLVLAIPDGPFYAFQGRVDGEIATDYKGTNGFGYDPLFIVTELRKRMAELTRDEKNRVSHRGRALQKLIEGIQDGTVDI